MNKILFILPWLPYPLTSGGNQAMFNGILAIAKDFQVYITYDTENNEQRHECEAQFQKLLPNVTLLPLLRNPKSKIHLLLKSIVSKIKAFTEKDKIPPIGWWRITVTPNDIAWMNHLQSIFSKYSFDIVQVEMPWRISDVFSLPESTYKIYVNHELGFVCRALEVKELKEEPLFVNAIRKYVDFNEIGQMNRYDSVITLSPIDTKKIIDAGVTIPVYSSFAVIEKKEIRPDIKRNPKHLVFIGPDSHKPNYVGLNWFLSNCWRKLKQKDREYTLDIIGKWSKENIDAIIEKYQGIHFLGFVEDLQATIQSNIMIVPITIGSGIRMKILEAANIGVPFVSTTVGAEGIPVKDGEDCYLADDPDTFVNNIIKLQNLDICKKFSHNAKIIIEKEYSLEALRENRLFIYSKLLSR